MRGIPCPDRAAPWLKALAMFWNAASWIVPGAMLVAMPKCPLCVAGYVALLTGLGLSFAAAYYTRLGLVALCVLMLAWQSRRLLPLRRSANRPPVFVPLQLPDDARN